MFFFAFFASYSLQRIFFADRAKKTKNSLFAPKYIPEPLKVNGWSAELPDIEWWNWKIYIWFSKLIFLYFISYWPGHEWSRLSPGLLEGGVLDGKMAWGSNGDDDGGGEDEDENDEN